MPFRNPILAGDTLIRVAMQSENFETGIAGWRIERDGDAEFNDITVRGRLVTTGPGGTVIIDDGEIEAIGADYTTEISNGRVLIYTQDVPDLSNVEIAPGLITMQDASGNQCAIEFNGNNMELSVNNGNGIVLDPNGYIYRKDSPVFNWTDITINSGSALGTAGPQCKLLPSGQVIFRGGITGFGVGAITIGTVPAGLRPATAQERYELPPNTSGAANAVAVNSNGTIVMTRNSVQSIWLSGIIYSVI